MIAPVSINSVRTTSESAPPTSPKAPAATTYMMPIFLWSTVVNQSSSTCARPPV